MQKMHIRAAKIMNCDGASGKRMKVRQFQPAMPGKAELGICIVYAITRTSARHITFNMYESRAIYCTGRMAPHSRGTICTWCSDGSRPLPWDSACGVVGSRSRCARSGLSLGRDGLGHIAGTNCNDESVKYERFR